MKQQFKLYRRGNGRYYAEDTTTGKQSSLGTRDKAEAHRLLHARNEAAYQPAFNKQMAKTYLAAGDPRANTRTWQDVMSYLLQSKEGRSQKTRERYESAIKEPGFDSIRNLPLIHTTAETLYKVLKDSGKPCTNMFLHRFHSFALKLGWLAWAVTYYTALRAKGKSNACALRALGQRWLKIVWKMWQKRKHHKFAIFHSAPFQNSA